MAMIIDQPVRILLDTASDMSSIPRENARVEVSGVSESIAGVRKRNSILNLSSRFISKSIFQLSAPVMAKLTKSVPAKKPLIYVVSLLCGLFGMTIIDGSKIKDINGKMVAVDSLFGWLICGEMQHYSFQVILNGPVVMERTS